MRNTTICNNYETKICLICNKIEPDADIGGRNVRPYRDLYNNQHRRTMVKKNVSHPYLERDISWMYFNRRVLQEASKDNVPLLERVSFLGIYSNNLDEFFRVRVASLNRIAEYDEKSGAKEAHLAARTVRTINRINDVYVSDFENEFSRIFMALRQEGIMLISDREADAEQLEFIHQYYRDKIDGLIVPIRFSAIEYLDHETDESIYMAVKASYINKNGKTNYEYAYFELPVQSCGRFVRLPDKEGKSYIMFIDDIVRCSLPKIFEGTEYENFEGYTFKFTRDAEMEIDNDGRNGILQKISKGLKDRKKGEPLRVVYDKDMPSDLLKRIMNRLDIGKTDTVSKSGHYQNHKDFIRFPDCGRKDLKYGPMPPIAKADLMGPESILEKISRRDRFLHVPYHSFNSFIRVLREAALDKNVHSIKITLYRLAKDSKVVRALVGAARNGKKVTVVIELLARFDEESNIQWSQKLQDAGVKVIYGLEGLKVHSKVVHIGMKRGKDIACISTGNFHEGNASSYTDCILMTAAKSIVSDAEKLFEFIEKPYIPVNFKELLVSPNEMKNRFMRLVNDEIRNKAAGKPAYIHVKINHLTDPVMVGKLYEAAENGVEVRVSVRGNCSVVTSRLRKYCDIRLNGIIDRYLEHSRIYIFAAGGKEKVFIGSADWMPRNLDNRIEVAVPVYDPEIKREMIRIVEYALRDTVQGRLVDGSGGNGPWTCSDPLPRSSQTELYEYYKSANCCGDSAPDSDIAGSTNICNN